MQEAKLEGLTEKEAASRLISEGPNEIPSGKSRGFLKIVLDTLKEPMLLMLLICAIIYFPLGNIEDAVILLCAALVIIVITIYQERKTENTLEALRELASPHAIVIREGLKKQIPGREVVREDIIELHEGSRVPADAIVVQTQNLQVDESLLTGESISVNKAIWNGTDPIGTTQPGGNNHPEVYFGSMVVSGSAMAKVYATGKNTELGKIGKSIGDIEREKTSLDAEVKRLVLIVSIYGLGACVLVFLLYGLLYAQWVKGLLSGLTLAMAMLPEEFPVVLTIFLSIGAWRIAKKNVLTRKLSAIETLGAATVLCVDKTGTITKNRMQVDSLYIPDEKINTDKHELPENFHELIEYAILASQKNPFDPMEKAFQDFGNIKLKGTEHIHDNWELVKEYPLSAKLMSMSEVWKSRQNEKYTIAAKGSPEAIMDLCHLNQHDIDKYLAEVNIMASNGLRILGVAKATKAGPLPGNDQHEFDFSFLGLIGLGDQIR